MRQDLRAVVGRPDHIGLAYGAWAPVAVPAQGGPPIPPDKLGKVPDGERAGWLQQLADREITSDYKTAFERWKGSFGPPFDCLADFTLAGRLLVGHGNASPTGFGLTLHHTWGVPIIPGSALKGLLAHHIDATYGPGNSLPPWQQQQTNDEKERARWQGVTWDDNRIKRGPGDLYRVLFGAPDAEGDEAMERHGFAAGASRGHVVFHDALYDPRGETGTTPFAVDVLTVHQKRYYDGAGTHDPCDYDDPNPVAFLGVRPHAKFLLALSGPADWTELAGALLRDALAQWGVGGKTAAGYGHGVVGPWSVPKGPEPPALKVLQDWLKVQQGELAQQNGLTQRMVLDRLREQQSDLLRKLPAPFRDSARQAIARVIKAKGVHDEREVFLNELWQS